tara:strand:+ start:7079 stop:7861 length:783 start_codon:yes stop_codon:yes gene_type:complete
MKIGFFDSGLGGLLILKAVVRELPEYNYEFYGDTANLPYGDKTEEEVYRLTCKGVTELFERNCRLVILACNSASAEAVRRLQREMLVGEYADHRILGVIVPTVEVVTELTKKDVLLIATRRTVESNKYQLELEKLNTKIELRQVAAPDLVPLIEIGDIDLATEEAMKVIETEGGESEVVVLGCTHYAKLKNQLRKKYPDKIFLSQDEIIPTKLKSYLQTHQEIESTLSKEGERNIQLTEHRPYYDQILQQLLGGVLVEEE